MNKNRLEALSDGVFAIVMTILALDFHLPGDVASSSVFAEELRELGPVFFAYIASFAVLDMFWISHNALFHIFTKTVNRIMVQLNMAYLLLMALVPFSAHLLAKHPHHELAVAIYGANIFLLGLMNYAMLRYALVSDEIDTDHILPRTIKQANIRMLLTPVMTIIGMALSFVSVPLAMAFYAFPVVFNIIPGILDRIERRLGLNFGEKDDAYNNLT